MDELNLDTMCAWIQSIAENLEDSSDFWHRPTYTRERMERPYEITRSEDDYRDRDNRGRDYRDRKYRGRPVGQSRPQSQPRSRSWSRSRSRSPTLICRRRENPRGRSRIQLWSYLRNKGENMKKWDGKPTSKLEARVRELKRKEADKKVIYVVNADVLRKELRPPRHKKAEVRFCDDKKASGGAKRKSDDEGSDQDQ